MILNELSENSQQVTTHLPQKLFSHKVVLPADTTFVQINRAKRKCIILTLFRLGFLRVVQIGGGWGGGGGGRKCLRPITLKLLKFGGVVKDH